MLDETHVNPWQPIQSLQAGDGPPEAAAAPISTPYFDSSKFRANEQFERFAMEVAQIGEMQPPKGTAYLRGYTAHLQGFDVASTRILVGGGEECTFVRTKHDAIRLGLDHWVLWFNSAGHIDIDMNGSTNRFNRNRLAFMSMEDALEARYTENETAYFFMPRSLFPGLEAVLQRRVDVPDDQDPLHPLLFEYLQILIRMLPKMTTLDAKAAEEATVAMVRAAICGSKDSVAEAQLPILASQFERAKTFIDANLSSRDLTPDSLQAALCISRSQLYKIFERSGGVNRFIRLRRLQACFRALQQETERRPIYQVAESFGFVNAANFSRLFRAEFDCTAEELRHTAQSQRTSLAYEAWLRERAPQIECGLQV